MRSQDEVQRAHDMLHGIVTKEVDVGMGPDDLRNTALVRGVLAWVLGGDESHPLAEMLADLDATLKAKGYRLAKGPQKDRR